MHTRTPITAALLLTAGLALAGCGGGGGDAKAAPSNGALSAQWHSRLDLLTNSGGVTACQDYSTAGCLTAMTSATKAIGAILHDINTGGLVAQYPKTVADLQKYVAADEDFSAAGCPGNPDAGQTLSQCYGDASAVTVGIGNLEADMVADEAG